MILSFLSLVSLVSCLVSLVSYLVSFQSLVSRSVSRMDKMKEGFSKIRNRALANAFAYMNLIEKWGSDVALAISCCVPSGFF